MNGAWGLGHASSPTLERTLLKSTDAKSFFVSGTEGRTVEKVEVGFLDGKLANVGINPI